LVDSHINAENILGTGCEWVVRIHLTTF
jgi:hypothetical protein